MIHKLNDWMTIEYQSNVISSTTIDEWSIDWMIEIISWDITYVQDAFEVNSCVVGDAMCYSSLAMKMLMQWGNVEINDKNPIFIFQHGIRFILYRR